MRLIDADAVDFTIPENPDFMIVLLMQVLKNVIDQAPTIDPESLRPQGEWVVTYYTTTSKRGRVIANAKYVCPECKHSNGRKRSNYCPNCGAKMKGAGEDA